MPETFEDAGEYPNCCTCTCIVGFEDDANQDLMVRELAKFCTEKQDNGYGMVTAMTTNHQDVANAALKEAGFIRTHWVTKGRHPENKIALWHKKLDR